MDPFEYGDPYIEWEETSASRDTEEVDEIDPLTEYLIEEKDMHVETLENLKNAVVKALITNHDFLSEEAESAVEESVVNEASIWDGNTDPNDLAKYLASDGAED